MLFLDSQTQLCVHCKWNSFSTNRELKFLEASGQKSLVWMPSHLAHMMICQAPTCREWEVCALSQLNSTTWLSLTFYAGTLLFSVWGRRTQTSQNQVPSTRSRFLPSTLSPRKTSSLTFWCNWSWGDEHPASHPGVTWLQDIQCACLWISERQSALGTPAARWTVEACLSFSIFITERSLRGQSDPHPKIQGCVKVKVHHLKSGGRRGDLFVLSQIKADLIPEVLFGKHQPGEGPFAWIIPFSYFSEVTRAAMKQNLCHHIMWRNIFWPSMETENLFLSSIPLLQEFPEVFSHTEKGKNCKELGCPSNVNAACPGSKFQGSVSARLFNISKEGGSPVQSGQDSPTCACTAI